MSYFSNFPSRYYQFDKDNIKLYTDISIRPAIVEQLVGDYSNLESYLIKDNETPEIIAYRYYGDVDLHWAIMITNNILSLYEDWPMNNGSFKDFVYEKYRTQYDSEGTEVVLTDDEVYEYVSFEGTPSNNYTSFINGLVEMKPHHFKDEDGNEYSYESYSANFDAFGRSIIQPDLFPVSHWDYEESLNEAKRLIYLPTSTIIRRMQKELGPLVNG